MSHIESAIYEKLKTFASGNVFAMRAPDNITSDFIIFQTLDGDRWRSINGPSGMAQITMQVDIYSKIFYTCKSISSDIEDTLDGFRGTVSYGTASPQDSVRIGGVSLISEIDLYDREEEPFLYRCSKTFLITYERG